MTGKRVFLIFFVIISSFVRVQAKNRTLTYGVIHEQSVEQEVIDFAVNKTSASDEVSTLLKRFSVDENTTLFHQALAFIQEDVIALLEGSSYTKTSTCALELSAGVTGIPVISLSRDTRPVGECGKTVQMQIGYRTYAKATLDSLNTFQWKNVALLYDADLLHEAGYFYSISKGSSIRVFFVQIPEKDESDDKTERISRAMEHLKELKLEAILLYTDAETLELLLKQKRCGTFDGYRWILQGQVPGILSSRPEHVVLAFRLPYNEKIAHDELKKDNKINTNTQSQKEIAAIAYDGIQVIKQAQNMEPCLSINGSAVTSKERDEMFSCLTKVNLDGITGPVRFSKDGKRTGAQLEILNLRNNSFKKVGIWNSTKKALLFENIHYNIYNNSRGRNLEGRVLRVLVVEDEPFVMSKRRQDGSISYEGYCIDLLRELAKRLHFTYHIKRSPDGLYGEKMKNGSSNGIIAELINKRADISFAALGITESRERVVDFTVPFMFYTEKMLLRKAVVNNGSIDLLQFMNPFQNDVWVATLVTLVVVSVAVFVLNYFSPYGDKDGNGPETPAKFSFFNSVWFALACMLQQGSENQPRSLSGRILTGCYWFCILIWVSTYTANLAAFFTVKHAQTPINNIEDIIASPYKVTVIKSGSTHEFFKTSKYETYQKIWHRIQADNSAVQSTKEALKLIRGVDDYVFISDKPTVQHMANKPPCDLITVSGLNVAKGLGLTLQANDPCVEEFSLAILRLHENGFIEGLRRKWWEPSTGCSTNKKETVLSQERINLKSMAGVYMVLGSGLVVAFFVLIAEIMWKRNEELRSRRRSITYL